MDLFTRAQGLPIAFTRGTTRAAVGDIDKALPSFRVGAILRHLFATVPGGPDRAGAYRSIEGVVRRKPTAPGRNAHPHRSRPTCLYWLDRHSRRRGSPDADRCRQYAL